MKFTRLAIPDVVLIEPTVYRDHRGYFLESWNRADFRAAGIDSDFVQDNQSKSAGNVLRGLHYQIQRPQGKLIRVLSGTIFDVAVDLRRSSPTFGKWVGAVLDADSFRSLWIPPKFAHGFYVLGGGAEILYKAGDFYAPEFERTIRYDDPEIGIDWNLSGTPICSDRDLNAPGIRDAEVYE